MNMKKYSANTMVDAMKKVRADFGDNAIILSSNVVKTKGFLGLFQKKSVEVVAAYDQPRKYTEQIHETSIVNHTDTATDELKKEMAEMKMMLGNIHPVIDHAHYPDEIQPLLKHLTQQSLAEKTVKKIGDELFNKMKQEKKDFSTEELRAITEKILLNEIKGLPFGGISLTKKYINVLGPTGVGKTTTIAKIAARALLEEKKKVGFITTDTYRIAAIEQLRTYANLLQAPVEIVYNDTDFKEAINKLSNLDLVFIDTAGRNYKEVKFVEDLTQIIDFSLDMESFLVLSMTSKEEDMRVIIEQFKSFQIEKFIFTKMDETGSVGPMFNLMKEYSIGTAYYTDGQEVPEDLTEATAENIVKLLLGGYRNA